MSALASVYKGIGLILVATLGIVLMNTCAKMGSLDHGPIEMVFYRGVVALGFLTPFMLLTQPLAVFRTRRLKAHLFRSAVGNLGVGFVFWAYALLPMADATALLFAAPLFVTVLSPVLLKEAPDRSRWLLAAVGFGGVLLMLQPSSDLLVNTAALVGLAAALCVALVDMALRSLGQTDDPLTTVFYFLLIGVLLTGPYTLVFGSLPGKDLMPWVIGIGIFAAIQQVAKTRAFQLAEVFLLSPFTYTAILWATFAGWIFWHDLPSRRVVVGAMVVMFSNLLMAWRERTKTWAGRDSL